MNSRIQQLLQAALRRDPDGARIGAEAERLMNAARKANASAPPLLQEAAALSHYYQHRDVVIGEHELIVGGTPYTEAAEPVRPQTFGRQDFAAVWFGEEMSAAVKAGFTEGLFRWAGNHTTTDFTVILSQGMDGVIARIGERRSRLAAADDPDGEKRRFLEALKTVALGYCAFCRRHADSALELAARTADPTRRAELEAIAANCRRVIAAPPATFWEACQALWFTFFMLPDAPGRIDQYLEPWYRHDLDSGRITRDAAKELLSCLWIKYFEVCGAGAGVSAHNHLTLGGVKPDGTDAANEVTWLCLEVMEELRLRRPQVGLRCHRATPPALLQRAIGALRSGCGSPDFCNDEQIVPALMHVGVSAVDARDFSLSGCHEVIVTGKSQMGSVEGFINLPKVLRMVLGLEGAGGGGGDLAAVTTLAVFEARLRDVLRQTASSAHEASLCRDRWSADVRREPLAASLVTSDCIENCRGYGRGGARYNFCNWNVIGLANAADSVSVIRRLVFADRRLSLADLAAIMAADWQGQEPLRRQILNEFPHYGNDEHDVDEIAAGLIRTLAELFREFTPFRGGVYILGTTAGGENMHIEFGRVTGATPDGRRAGEPLADSMGAAQGRDRHGVTALLNSVTMLPHRLLPTAATLNVRLDPRLIGTDEGVDKITALVRAHFQAGGQQIQFNFLDRATLLAAKRDPEQHRDLMVRVAGYSAPFVALWGDLQDEIISRTEHTG